MSEPTTTFAEVDEKIEEAKEQEAACIELLEKLTGADGDQS